MHISLDSALGQQRRLNQVGESITQIAPDPAVAYSLRSLTGGDPKVVRVRRESDNHEQDFTASEVSSGALVDFVNTQVTAPLDIQALTATGRDGDFLIAKAAYSLRSLGTRQATVAATGDTVARANGKYVCQVRRPSDDALKSFTAAEVTDGTLLSFVTEEVTLLDATDFSSSLPSPLSTFTGSPAVLTSTFGQSIGGSDNVVLIERTSESTSGVILRYLGQPNIFQGDTATFTAEVFLPNSNTSTGLKLLTSNLSSGDVHNVQLTKGSWQTISVTGTMSADSAFNNWRIGGWIDASGSAVGSVGEKVYIRKYELKVKSSDGFVKTWYDQSVTTQAGDTATGNHATQATAANQPKIVSAGSLLTDGINFDGSNDLLSGTTISSLASGAVFYVFKSEATDEGQLFQFSNGSTYSTSATINSGSEGRLVASSDASTDSRNGPVFGATGVTTNQKHLLSLVLDSSTEVTTATVDGSSMSSGASPTGRFDANISILSIGQRGDNSFSIQNSVSEVIIYDTDQTDNRTAIEANIGEHYSISGIPAFDNSVNGFVETWYDQSGNGRDAVQATASKQPFIVESGSLNVDSFSNPTIRFEKDLETHFITTDETLDPNLEVSAFVVQKDEQVVNQNSGWAAMRRNDSSGRRSAFEMGVNRSSERFRLVYDPLADNTNRDDIEVTVASDGLGTTSIMSSIKTSSGDLDGFFNGSSVIDTTVTDNTDLGSGYGFAIGKHTNSTQFADGRLNEVIFYLSDQTANRSAIETNLANHYGITLL